MVMDAEGAVGTTPDLTNKPSKGKSGRTMPLADELRVALVTLKDKRNPDAKDRIVHSERGLGMSPGAVPVWFHRHPGLCRRIQPQRPALRDVQELAGHASLATTQRYIQGGSDAKRNVVNL